MKHRSKLLYTSIHTFLSFIECLYVVAITPHTPQLIYPIKYAIYTAIIGDMRNTTIEIKNGGSCQLASVFCGVFFIYCI